MSQRIFSASDFQDPPARGSRSGGGSLAARLVSALIGLVVTTPALILVMAGGARIYADTLQQAKTETAIPTVLLLSAGLVLMLVVALSGMLSAAGPLIAGLTCTALGIAFLVAPALIGSVAAVLPSFGVSAASLVYFWCPSGLLLVVGVMFLASSLARLVAARATRSARGGVRAVISLVVVLVATPLGVGLVAAGSTGLLIAISAGPEASTAEPSTLGLLLAGAAVLAGVTLTAAWSSVGASIGGALVLLVGLLAVIPAAVIFIYSTAASQIGGDVASGVGSAVALGFVAVLGIIVLGAGASAARARRVGR